MAQNVAKPRRIRPRMALTRRKKIGPIRLGMKRTTMTSAANQVIRPAAGIRIPHSGVLMPRTEGEGKPVGGNANPVKYG